mmetsp:Transcript_23916/g.67517  ORF Transcript_23916/g.67517 Transcript_23916/m.67517 type:complete len:228 (+) Transcript_23916:381-1064(+)
MVQHCARSYNALVEHSTASLLWKPSMVRCLDRLREKPGGRIGITLVPVNLFLWRMRNHRLAPKTRSVLEQAQLESEIDVFPYANANDFIQLCTHDRLAVGGGGGGGSADHHGDIATAAESLNLLEVTSSRRSLDVREDEVGEKKEEHPASVQSWGFGLTIDGDDLLHGTTSPCLTFRSPSLSKVHDDGSKFEIVNLELWTMTPCTTEAEAEKMELSKMFLDRHLVRR